MAKSYTAEELTSLKAMFFESKYISITYFLKRFDPEFQETMKKHYRNDLHPLIAWEREKQQWLKTKETEATNLSQSYAANVSERFDLTSYLQERLIEISQEQNLNMLDLKRLVDIIDTLSKIQDRTAAISNTVAVAAASSGKGGYEEQKKRVEVLLKAAMIETGIASEGDKDELEPADTDPEVR